MKRRAGFTLLEVLVAVTVIATGVTALLRLAGQSSGVLAGEEPRTRALLAARALLVEAELNPPPLGARHGVRSDGLAWEETVTPTPHPRLRHVQVRVFHAPEHAVELEEIVRVPAA